MGHEMLIDLNHHCLPRRVLVGPVPTMKPAPTHRTAAKTGGYLMAEMMNAALMYGPGDIRVEQMPKPTCPPGRFVLRVDAVGLCGSDIRNLTTDSRKGDYPFIYGHYGATSVQVQKAFELVINDKFPAEQVISKVLPLSRINDAIEFTRTGEALRVVLVPDGKESEHHGK
jgi:alcohol dehydrogenase